MNNQVKINFVIQATEIKTGSNKFYKSLKDKDGFYELPGFVFDVPSRNRKLYDTPAMVECVTNPNTRFYRMLTDSTLHAEWGHPKDVSFSRLTSIDENNYSHFIKGIRTDNLKTGEKVIWVKFKPCGPKGKFFEEALEDEHRNACLSIRVACVDGPMIGEIQRLYPKFMVTFDAVGGGGFQQASKKFAIENSNISMEDYSYYFDEKDITEEVGRNLVHMESYSKDSILEYFRADSIKTVSKIITPSIQAVNFHNAFKRGF